MLTDEQIRQIWRDSIRNNWSQQDEYREAYRLGVAVERKRCAEVCRKRMAADSNMAHPIKTTQWLEAHNCALDIERGEDA